MRNLLLNPENDLSPAAIMLSEGLVRPHPEASGFIDVSRAQIYLMMQKGLLPFVKVGRGGRRIPRKALRDYLKKNLVLGQDQTA